MKSLSLLLTGHWLVVDDQEMCRLAAFRALEELGATCDFASDGLEALVALENFSYSGMLIDGSMPNMSGFEAVAKTRQLEADLARDALLIIMITGEPNVAVRNCGRIVDLIMQKPLRLRPNSLLPDIAEISVMRAGHQTGPFHASKAGDRIRSAAGAVAKVFARTKSVGPLERVAPLIGARRPPEDIGPMVQLLQKPLRHSRAEVEAITGLLRGTEPRERLELERHAVALSFIDSLGACLGMPPARNLEILGLPSLLRTGLIRGTPAFAALALTQLLGKALQLLKKSTSVKASGFDMGAWLGQWIETPQPAIGDLRPSSIVAFPTGLPFLSKVMGSIASGSFQ